MILSLNDPSLCKVCGDLIKGFYGGRCEDCWVSSISSAFRARKLASDSSSRDRAMITIKVDETQPVKVNKLASHRRGAKREPGSTKQVHENPRLDG